MFTGIVEEIGTLLQINQTGQSYELMIQAKRVLDDVRVGDSISVNGVCLTVTSFQAGSFAADVVPETLRRTNLSRLRIGFPLNLERAMAANGRFGGHIVSGHIDGTAHIVHKHKEVNALVYTFRPNQSDMLKYIIAKGSVALDGTSLTVMDVAEDHFRVSVIPHTLEQTILRHKDAGDTVNVECDIVGKYIERLMQWQGKPSGTPSRITEQLLADNGFI